MDAIWKNFIEFISKPLVSNIISIIVSLLSVLPIVINAKKKCLYWGAKKTKLNTAIFPETGKLKVSYRKSKSLKNVTHGLSLSRIAFWNTGKEVLSEGDISSKEPLEVNFYHEGCEILEIREVSKSNPTIYFKQIGSNRIRLLFEYLETNQGAVFDVVCVGQTAYLDIVGVLKGGKIKTKEITPLPITLSTSPRLYLLMGWMKPVYQILTLRWLFTIGLVTGVWGIVSSLINPNAEKWFYWMFMGVYTLACVIMCSEFWKMAIVPKELRDFYSKID